MAGGNDMCPFQQTLADSRLFRCFTQCGSYRVFSNGRPATSLNGVHKSARQRLDAGTGVVLACDENDMPEIIQKNGIRRMPEMYGDLSTVRRPNNAKRINSLIGVVSKIPVELFG